MKYYNKKKYYVNRALRIAKKNHFEESISDLILLKRQHNTFLIEDIKKLSNLNVFKTDLFNIELSKLKESQLDEEKE